MNLHNVLRYGAKYRKKILLATAATGSVIALLATYNYLHIGQQSAYVYAHEKTLRSQLDGDKTVGIVLGGGIKDGKPKPVLQSRLDTAANLLKSGTVRKLIVSGDNRFVHYNEPQVMKNYLVRKKGINADKIQLDNAGRSTYETCERASKIFDLKKTVLISESSHLVRAVYLCRSFGIETYGFQSDGEATSGLRLGQRWREVMARTKAVINVHLIGEQTILGEKIKV